MDANVQGDKRPGGAGCETPVYNKRIHLAEAEKEKKRIAVVGCYPPPFGGVSVHIQRLKREFSHCFTVRVIDVHNSGNGNQISPGVYRCGAPVPINLWRSVKCLRTFAPNVAHFHVSAMSRFVIAGLVFIMALKKETKTIITIHSGSFVQQYRQSGRLRQMMVKRLLRVFDHVICVSGENKELLGELDIPEQRVSVIPAFLPPIAEESTEIEDEVERLREGTRKIILVSGSALEYYGFHLVLDAINDLGAMRNDLAVIFVFYHMSDREYVSVLQRNLNQGVPYRIFENLTPGEFSFLLSRIDIFIRPTDRDGDAVALREAIYYRKQVIASDCVERAHGVVLFKTGSTDSLKTAIEQTVHNPERGLSTFDVAESRNNLLSIYRAVLGGRE